MHSVTSVAKPPTATAGCAPGDDAREDVAAQVIAAADQAVFTGRAHGRSDHLEGIHRVDQRAHASEQQDGPEQNQPKHGGPVLQVHLPRFTQGGLFLVFPSGALFGHGYLLPHSHFGIKKPVGEVGQDVGDDDHEHGEQKRMPSSVG